MAAGVYATPDAYRALCPEATAGLEDAELNRQLGLASDAVDALCFGRIRRMGVEGLTSFQLEKVARATCLHAAFLARGGGDGVTEYAIGDVKLHLDRGALETRGGVTTSCEVMAQLRQTGLVLRQII
ncbi:MAG: hypothetical protein PHO10_03055 [Gemmiger sp.]|nr:hypothetical protein [Gemmiger sp.]